MPTLFSCTLAARLQPTNAESPIRCAHLYGGWTFQERREAACLDTFVHMLDKFAAGHTFGFFADLLLNAPFHVNTVEFFSHLLYLFAPSGCRELSSFLIPA